METKFQTSFIPKKPLVSNQPLSSSRPRRKGGGVFSFIAIILFIVSVAGAGFSVLWQRILTTQQESYKRELQSKETRFNTTLIEEIKETSTKIDLSTELLRNHLAVSEIFSIISRLTAEDVRFTSFEFTAPQNSREDIKIVMKGRGRSYKSIAFQSDVLGKSQLYGKNRVVKNPIVSDLAVDQNGGVTFTLSASLSADDVLYEKIIAGEASPIESASAPNQ